MILTNRDSSVSDASQANSLLTRLRLRVHASNLPRTGVLQTLPDTFARVVSVLPASDAPSGPEQTESDTVDHRGTRSIQWGRTELIQKCSHPQYTKTFSLKYEYGAEYYFFIELYRLDPKTSTPILLGSALFEVGDVLGTKNHTKVKRLRKGGCIFCRLEHVQEEMQNSVVRFQFSAKNIDVGRKGRAVIPKLSTHPNTIMEIWKRHDAKNSEAWTTVYRSRPVENSLNPAWDVGQMNYAALCNGSLTQPVRIVVKVHRESAANVEIGFCETNLNNILRTQQDLQPDDPCYDASKNGFVIQRSIVKTKEVGRLVVDLAQLFDETDDVGVTSSTQKQFDEMSAMTEDDTPVAVWAGSRSGVVDVAALPVPVEAPASFQDYMDYGCKLDFCIAIDFTSSNGDPRIPGTHHFQDDTQLNDYEEIIASLGASIERYSDECSVFGFGAKFNGVTRHLFQCGENTAVQGVEGMLDAYRSVFQSDLIMSGPTKFDQILRYAGSRANRFKEEAGQRLRYMVLLVITDGSVSNIEETKRKLAVYTSVPLSVIFVGVGRSDFDSLNSLAEPALGQRANATFCEFRQHQQNPISLGMSALAELPNQLVEYMISNDIRPS